MTAYLLDTHVILWTLYDSARLPSNVKYIVKNEECCISVASYWEMAIKSRLGKLTLQHDVEGIADYFTRAGIRTRGITPADCNETARLPLIHKDPFDRMIVAQARVSGLVVVTKDGFIPQYDVATVWDD